MGYPLLVAADHIDLHYFWSNRFILVEVERTGGWVPRLSLCLASSRLALGLTLGKACSSPPVDREAP